MVTVKVVHLWIWKFKLSMRTMKSIPRIFAAYMKQHVIEFSGSPEVRKKNKCNNDEFGLNEKGEKDGSELV